LALERGEEVVERLHMQFGIPDLVGCQSLLPLEVAFMCSVRGLCHNNSSLHCRKWQLLDQGHDVSAKKRGQIGMLHHTRGK